MVEADGGTGVAPTPWKSGWQGPSWARSPLGWPPSCAQVRAGASCLGPIRDAPRQPQPGRRARQPRRRMLPTMPHLRRLFAPKMRKPVDAQAREPGPPDRAPGAARNAEPPPAAPAGPRPTFVVPADLIGHRLEVPFSVVRPSPGVVTSRRTTFVAIATDAHVLFAFPALEGFAHPPKTSAFPLEPDARYVVSGSVDLLGESRVSLFLIYFDDEQRIHRDSVRLGQGGFTREQSARRRHQGGAGVSGRRPSLLCRA